ncbi:MAG TPA: BBE domain-containing protein, partial [Longimicrobiales bacterium]|nr:BBE domain-containing protein [Longimicrobiales bacterium]
ALLPPGLQHYWKADYVKELTDDAIEAHLEHGPRVPSVQTAVHLYAMNGAVQEVDPGDTAFARRDCKFVLNIAGIWEDPADTEDNVAWVRDYYDAVHPHSGFEGGYTNFMTEEDQDRVRENYGESYDRLAEVKGRWDPDNLFRLNQNVAPAG